MTAVCNSLPKTRFAVIAEANVQPAPLIVALFSFGFEKSGTFYRHKTNQRLSRQLIVRRL